LKIQKSPYKKYREFISSPFINNYLLFIDAKIRSGRDLSRRRIPLTGPLVKKRKMVECKYDGLGSIL
jgi:hypothetical protein